ncbi:hypothetical protein PI126_g21887 [Phytophthora idaei]|nr:hypothetical protein PI126_g21887 [Phytophthora idaei]
MQMLQQMQQMNMMMIQQKQKQASPQPLSPRRPAVNAVTTEAVALVQPSGTIGNSCRAPNIRMGPDNPYA